MSIPTDPALASALSASGDAARHVYLDRPTLRRLLHLASRPGVPWRRKLWGWTILAILLAFHAHVSLFRRLDALLFPGIAEVEVRRPVFVFANARSGTTLLHRLMTLDRERYVHLELHHTLFHSLVAARVARAFEGIDRVLRWPMQRAIHAFERQFWGFWRGIHRVGLAEAEEDEGWFLFTLFTPALFLLTPWTEELSRVGWLDDAPAPVRARLAAEYRGLVQRQLHDFEERTFLNKSVMLASRLETVWAAFPDARFVYLVRHPYEAIPSFLSMAAAVYDLHSPEIARDDPEMRALAEWAMRLYRRGWEWQRAIPAEQYVRVRYDDLVADPEATVLRVYEALGMEAGDAFRARLREATHRARAHRSGHDYALSDFGLTREDVRAHLGDVMEDLGFAP